MNIKAIIFDLDGTLLDRDLSLRSFIAAQYDRFLPAFKQISKQDYLEQFIQLDCRGHVWKDKVYQSLIKRFNITELTWQQLLNDYETQFKYYCIAIPTLKETLATLQQQNYLLGIITNGRGKFQARAIEGLKIRNYFDTILISETEQIRKPEPEIFYRALSRLKVSATESVYVGDNPDADIIGAKKAGLKAIWQRNSFWQEPQLADAVIDRLDEIPSIVATM